MANANSTRATTGAENTTRPAHNPSTLLHEVGSANACAEHDGDYESEFWLNERPARIERIYEEGVTVSAAVSVLNKLYRSVQGIAAITQILDNDNTARTSAQPCLNNFLVGGLLSAANILAENAEDAICNLAESAEKRSEGGGHG